MADSSTSPETTAERTRQPADSDSSIPRPDPSQASAPLSTTLPVNPNPTTPPPPPSSLPPPPSIQPSFRPAAPPVPVPSASASPQFSPLPPQQAPNYGVPPPGVSAVPQMAMPPHASGAPPVPGASMPPVMMPYAIPGQPMRPYSPMPNGYPPMPQPVAQGTMLPPGVPRYPSPYMPMIRPAFPPRPLGPVVPPLARPPIPGVRGPLAPPATRPAGIPSVTPTEKPQTTVYVGKISSTVENDFMLSLLQLCGPVKSWKRAQDPTNGTLKGFGFCEFESAEGVLRALRLLNKLSVDGQELMLNVNQATRDYLERYVEKKLESSKNSKETEGTEKEEENVSGAEKTDAVKSTEESIKPPLEEQKKDDSERANKENLDAANFGLVTDGDREADKEALEKLKSMIEERLKTNPLPPPPPTAADGSGNSNTELRSRDREVDVDVKDDASEDKNEDDKIGESRLSSERDRSEIGSPDRSKRRDRSRERERELKRDKERELERYEREREQERAKREKEREYRSREDERRYKAREKEWETREREKEHWRKREREREKERAQERKWEIIDQERESDDGYGKRRKYKSSDEERKRRQREKEEDIADRLKEEEEIAEAKRRADEEKQKKREEALKIMPGYPVDGNVKADLPDGKDLMNKDSETSDIGPGHANYNGGILQNGGSDESTMPSAAASDPRQNSIAPTKKLGFGLQGSGKRTAVPSVFNEDEDDDAHKEKKMRPLVPIDYSTEEQQAVQPSIAEAPPSNVFAAAEYAKRISTVNTKEEKPDSDKEKIRRTHDRSSQRDRDRHEDGTNLTREESRKDGPDRDCTGEHGSLKSRTPDNQKLLDAKQLIDTIPKTKDELFSYKINWAIYDKNALHERMRPWISKKITEFLGEEEVTLVDYIVSTTQEHVGAAEMLDRLQTILDDEAEMFVLKMWRMLIFEIKKVETGLALKPKT